MKNPDSMYIMGHNFERGSERPKADQRLDAQEERLVQGAPT